LPNVIPAVLALLQQVPRGALRASGDSLLPVQDTLAAAAGQVRDTLRAPPLPAGVAALVRSIFNMPRWIQLSGIAVGTVVGIALIALVWIRRHRILNWLKTRRRGVQWTMAGCAVLVLALAAFAGGKSWHYMQHDNGFCTGCHIMERPFGRFGVFAGKHDNRACHDCHQQSLYASTRQLVLWVANRPSEIGKHAPVPNSRCESCHQLATGKKPWQHALWLAGHKAHFESDSAPLRGLLCVKCHGAEIHRFLPSTRTCQQEGCHVNQQVKLGKMAKLPEISCVTCHAFTADLPALADRDSAAHALIPSQKQCLSCHGMQGKPPGYVAAKDPHKGLCGSCHDVHKDLSPADARTSCQRCHADVASNPFHAGVNHRRIATQCLVCHQPHAASVDASDCVGCHTAVQKRGKFHPPLPFDTNRVVRRRVSPPPGAAASEIEDQPQEHRGKGDALPDVRPPIRDAPPAALRTASDSFPHARHTSLPCLTCHVVSRNSSKYGLVFEVPRGCDLCHHQSLMAGTVDAKDCTRCHRPDALAVPRPTPVAIAVGAGPPAVRNVAFRHERHQRLACSTCHQPPAPTPPDSIRTCKACHAQHHSAERNCVSCHFRAETPAAHSRTTHTGCDVCHTPARIAALVPGRNFCLTCHAPQQTHQPGRECTTCHFLMTPEAFRPRLLRGTGA
jgi:hypothetical protein